MFNWLVGNYVNSLRNTGNDLYCQCYQIQESPILKPTILVVDDEEDILELVRYNLAREGYEIVEAHTGEETLRKASKNAPTC